ncbi:MAG: hypothetical protein EOO53_14125 [Gammaproteobacteria bacterium]|nr:MAG: hypothetical protein EOO53_14125 [Gammaproteobacteria bacterium]
MPSKKYIARFFSALFIFPLMFLHASSAWALASVSISPSPSYTGNYIVSWTGNDGGAGGNLYENDVAISSIGSSNSGSFSVSGKAGGNYNYYIIYYYRTSPGTSTRSPSSTVSVIKTPSAPGSVNVRQDKATIVISGYNVAQATNYNYQRIGGTPLSGNTAASLFSDPSISFDTSYYYRVQACNTAGCSGTWTNSASISIPPIPTAPASVTATPSGTAIALSYYSSRATNYSITRSPAFVNSPVVVNSPNFNDTSAALGVTYTYQVTALNATGNSVAVSSNSVRLPPKPSPPLAIWGNPAGTSVLVGWNSSPEATNYTLINSLGLNITLSGVNNTSYQDYAISPGQQIVYQVNACNSSGCSDFTRSSSVTIPALFYVTNNDNDGNFTLNWSGVATDARIFQTMPNGSTVAVMPHGGSTGTFPITGKTGGSTSNYFLENWYHPPTAGDFVYYGQTSLSVTVAQLLAPSFITATLNANTGNGPSISVNWGESPGNNVTYNLARNNSVYTLAAGNLDKSLTANTSYNYSVYACKGTNCSSAITSSIVNVPPVPSVPSFINASQNLKTVDVKWGASSNATSYEVTRNSVTISNANVTALNDPGISVLVPTTYAARACNIAWCSNFVSASTITLPPIPSIPAAISATVNLSSITINGGASNYANKYSWRKNGVAINGMDDESNVYADLNVVNGTQYTYSVQACNATGCSDWITATPVVGGAVKAGVQVKLNYKYDALGRLRVVNENTIPKTNYNYDAAGNRKTVEEK